MCCDQTRLQTLFKVCVFWGRLEWDGGSVWLSQKAKANLICGLNDQRGGLDDISHHYSKRLICFQGTFRLINEHVCSLLLFNAIKRNTALEVTALCSRSEEIIMLT